MDVAQQVTDTPIYDGVLGDRLAAAGEAVRQARRDADQFRAAMDAGTAAALEQQTQQRATALVQERTSALMARVEELERQLQSAHDRLAAATAAVSEPVPEPVVPEPAPQAIEPESGPRPESESESESESDSEPEPDVDDPEADIRPDDDKGPSRRARDEGPTGSDIPSVPSMKDIFASTRATGWLDSLLGGKR